MAFPIPTSAGAVKFQDGVSLEVLVATGAARVPTFAPRLSTPCGVGSSLTVTLSTTSGGGGGDDIVATFAAGERAPGTVAGGPVVMTLGQTLFVAISSASADEAFDLSGYVDGDFASATVTAFFTTLARVINHGKLTSTTAQDTEIVTLIPEVSNLMQLRLWNQIERVVGKVEFYDNGHRAHTIVTDQPIADIAAVEVREPPFATEDIVPAAEVRVEKPKLLTRLDTTGQRLRWGRGEFQITYDAGYAEIPPALVLAATDEVLFRLGSSGFGPSSRVGVSSRTDAEGSSETYEIGGLLQRTIDAIDLHNRHGVHS